MNFRDSCMGYGAALWALVFAMLHVVWGTGWHVGLDPELARKAFEQRWFLVYDLAVAGVCVLAVGVALALVQPWGLRLRRGLIGMLAWFGTGLLVLRGGAGVVQTVYFTATGRPVSAVGTFWELWFCLGAILFGMSTWRFWRVSAPTAR